MNAFGDEKIFQKSPKISITAGTTPQRTQTMDKNGMDKNGMVRFSWKMGPSVLWKGLVAHELGGGATLDVPRGALPLLERRQGTGSGHV